MHEQTVIHSFFHANDQYRAFVGVVSHFRIMSNLPNPNQHPNQWDELVNIFSSGRISVGVQRRMIMTPPGGRFHELGVLLLNFFKLT